MDLDLSLRALLDAAGGSLFFLEGLAILVLARGSRRGTLIGGLATTFGLSMVIQNLVVYQGGFGATDAALVATVAAAAVFAILLAHEESRRLSSRGRRWALGYAAALVIPVAGTTYAMVTDAVARSTIAAANAAPWGWPFLVAMIAGLNLVLGVIGFGWGRGAPSQGHDSAAAGLALSFGLWAVFFQFGLVPVAGVLWSASPSLGLSAIAVAVLAAFPIHVFALPRGVHANRVHRIVHLALFGAAMAGLLHGIVLLPPFSIAEFGANGMVRTVGAFLLAVAVLRHDLLGVPLPRIVVKRGVVATGALAILFIVAQVAENFLSDEYGLLTGGVIAGGFLFMANPVQRAVERLGSRGERPTEPGAAPAGTGNEETFRTAVHMAFRDRRFSQSEELALADLAERLGIGARRATEIRHGVEQEKGVA